MCEECLVVNILWLIILVIRVDRYCYYRCLSAVVMKRTLIQMSHILCSSKCWRLNKNTTDELNTDTLTMDLCEKTKCPLRVNRPQEVKVLHINLYCSCHLHGGVGGVMMEDWSVRSTAFAGNMRQVRWEAGKGNVIVSHLVAAFQIHWERLCCWLKVKINLKSVFVKRKFLRNECNQQRC